MRDVVEEEKKEQPKDDTISKNDFRSELETQFPGDPSAPNAPNTTLFLHTDWNQIELYKLYRKCKNKSEFHDFCKEEYGNFEFDPNLLCDAMELKQM